MTSANQPGAPPLRVFLCHASEDKAAVRKLRRKLQQSGIDPWMDENKLLPGQQWQDEITRALRTCDAVLVCISRGSLTKEGFLQREIRIILEIADEKPDPVIFLIPVLLEKLNREELPRG